MNTSLPPAPEPESKPHWPAPAAAAGAMAAGLMVGRKGALGLALGVAAMAGARWLLARQHEHEPRVEPVTPETISTPVSEEAPAVLAKMEKPPSVLLEPEHSAPVIIYEQPCEMPSCNVAPEGSVWFALFNEAPLALTDAPPPDERPSDELTAAAPMDHAAENAFSAEPLPESFFSEAPGIVESLEEGAPIETKDLPAGVQAEESSAVQEVLPKSIDEAAKPMDLFSRRAETEPALPNDKVRPVSVLHRIVARPLTEATERVPRSAAPAALPQKRAEGEAPKAWIVPAPEWQTTLQSKRNPEGAPVHRAIVPHGMVAQAQTTRRWPLVTAVMVVLFAAVVLALHGAGLDGGMIKEWKLHWKKLNPMATESSEPAWSKDRRSQMAASPRVGQ